MKLHSQSGLKSTYIDVSTEEHIRTLRREVIGHVLGNEVSQRQIESYEQLCEDNNVRLDNLTYQVTRLPSAKSYDELQIFQNEKRRGIIMHFRNQGIVNIERV